MGDWYGVSQVTDHAYRIVGIDHLQEPTLLQRFSIIEVWSKRLKAASLKPCRVIIDLINDVIGRLGKSSLGIVGYDQEPKATCETKVIGRSVHLLQLSDIAVIHISARPWHGEAVAEADGAAQRRRREAAEPDRRMRFLDRLRRHLDVLEIDRPKELGG